MSTKRLHDWLVETGLDISPGFRTALRQRFGEEAQQTRHTEPSDLEKRSLLRLVAGMAIKGYRYDPRNQRNEAVQEISDDLDRLGISLDLKTIRKWLKESCKLIEHENLDK